jgi:hypothetical protein
MNSEDIGKLIWPIRNSLQSVLTHTFTHVCAGASVDTAGCVALPGVNYGAAAYFTSFIFARHCILIRTTSYYLKCLTVLGFFERTFHFFSEATLGESLRIHHSKILVMKTDLVD